MVVVKMDLRHKGTPVAPPFDQRLNDGETVTIDVGGPTFYYLRREQPGRGSMLYHGHVPTPEQDARLNAELVGAGFVKYERQTDGSVTQRSLDPSTVFVCRERDDVPVTREAYLKVIEEREELRADRDGWKRRCGEKDAEARRIFDVLTEKERLLADMTIERDKAIADRNKWFDEVDRITAINRELTAKERKALEDRDRWATLAGQYETKVNNLERDIVAYKEARDFRSTELGEARRQLATLSAEYDALEKSYTELSLKSAVRLEAQDGDVVFLTTVKEFPAAVMERLQARLAAARPEVRFVISPGIHVTAVIGKKEG